MASHRYIDRVCLAAAIMSLLITACLMGGEALGIRPASREAGYEERLFDTARVHTIEIVMEGWEEFLETCENEEYAACSVMIDNEAYKNVGLRAKGNTSLSTVSALGSDRYSFKIEFDHYESGKSYHGLDKLCLNNLIQDNTYLKDYLTYRMMAEFGAAAPLCSFVRITVNGQDWGLYLAVEGVEDGFLQRSYGAQHGSLYKPDSLNFGGGRGNGRDFRMEDMDFDGDFAPPDGVRPHRAPSVPLDGASSGGGGSAPPDGMPSGEEADAGTGGAPDLPSWGGMGGGPGGMGSDDVKLKYTDDDPASYANIFENAKTEISETDQTRLIRALKGLGEGDDSVLDQDALLRYLVVHNFVVNGDSYTGSMVHNYYLYEENGRLSMIPWDYNLAFGTFQGNRASSAVNDPIDTPLSVTGDGERPMMDWILGSEEKVALYHQYFAEFLETVDPAAIIEEAYALIADDVKWDPSKFCTEEEFETGVEALKTFCRLREQSVSGQLAGTIPSTAEGQLADGGSLVDASGLVLSDMGTMSIGGGVPSSGGFSRENGQKPEGGAPPASPDRLMEADSGGPPAQSGTLLCLAAGLALLGGLVVAFRWRRWG